MREISSTARGQRFRLLRGTLSVAAPTSYVLLEALDPQRALQGSWAGYGRGGLLVAGLLVAAALSITRLPLLGRSIGSLAAFLLAGVGAFALGHSPALALTVLLVLAAGMGWLWFDEIAPREVAEEDLPSPAGVGSECFLALLAWLLVGPARAAESEGALLAATLALAACTIGGARRILEGGFGRSVRWLVALLLSLPPVASLLAVVLGRLPPGYGIDLLAAGPSLLLFWASAQRQRLGEASWLGAVLEHPARLVVVTFVVLSVGGAVLLSLPASSPHDITALDALFTSVSAVCVTGLVVLDTPSAWTSWGHGILLGLIQLGGLGIMTFYAAAVPLLGRRLSMRHERAVAGALSIEDRGHLYGVLRRILGVTFGCELVGTALLFSAFRAEERLAGEALWKALFTSVSAFCNAGFALDSDSLISYQQDSLVLHTVALLIVAGGLSPVAVVGIPRAFGRRRRGLSLELKLVYMTSAFLLVSGTAAYSVFEWNASLGSLGWVDRLQNAWFQSVSTRTAGFNSVDLEATRPATQAVMIFLMFVGGSPGGTAGGIKTTTFAALCLAVLAALQGREEAVAFGRRLHHVSIYKAAAITTMGILSVVAVLVMLLLSQPLLPHVAAFEAVSALGTVGWSLGATGELDEIGKSLLILCMLAGRVGPLTLFVILVERRYDSAWVYPHEDVRVG